MPYKDEAMVCEECGQSLRDACEGAGPLLELEEVNGQGTVGLFCDWQCFLDWAHKQSVPMA